ncbi:MAG: type II toxin-antitoxin system HicB family antitoxin [bacterium]
MKTHLFPIVIECMEEGGYYAECPLLQGCHVEGETYAEAIENIQDAIKVFLDSYQELGKDFPQVPIYEGNIVITSGIPILEKV